MNAQESMEYAIKMAQESGASEAEVAAIKSVFGNDKFRQGFVPTPEFSRGLDSERAKAKKVDDYYRNDWYPKAEATVKSYAEKATQAETRLAQYERLYGPIETAADANRAATATGLGINEVDKLVNAKLQAALNAQGNAALELMDIREQHRDSFGKRLDTKDFERFVEDQQSNNSFRDLRSAYESYVKPQAEKLQEQERATFKKQITEEAIRDYQSKHGLPTSDEPTERSILFRDRSQDGKDGNGNNGTSARDEFREIMRNQHDPDLRRKYPV